MPIPQIFGAPQAPDVGGVIAAKIGADAQARSDATQARLATMQMVLGALQSAMELRAKREAQIREIQANQTLQSQALQAKAAEEQKNRQTQTRIERMQQRGENVRTFREMKQREGQFQAEQKLREEQLGLSREQLGITREDLQLRREQQAAELHSRALSDESALQKLREGYEAEKQHQSIDFAHSLLGPALAMHPLVANPSVPGGVSVDLDSINAMMTGLRSLPGPQNAGVREMAGRPDVLPELTKSLQGLTEPGNKLAVSGAEIGARGGGLSGSPILGMLPVPASTLDELAKMASSKDATVLHALTQNANAGNAPLFDFSSGEFRVQGNPDAEALLNRLANNGVGTKDTVAGSIAGPMLGKSEQTKLGANLLGNGRAARPQTPQAQPAEKPKPAPKSKVQPAPESQPSSQAPPSDYEHAGQTMGTEQGTRLPQPTGEEMQQRAQTLDEKVRAAAEKYKARVGAARAGVRGGSRPKAMTGAGGGGR